MQIYGKSLQEIIQYICGNFIFTTVCHVNVFCCHLRQILEQYINARSMNYSTCHAIRLGLVRNEMVHSHSSFCLACLLIGKSSHPLLCMQQYVILKSHKYHMLITVFCTWLTQNGFSRSFRAMVSNRCFSVNSGRISLKLKLGVLLYVFFMSGTSNSILWLYFNLVFLAS